MQRLARALYNRLTVFVGHLNRVGRQLASSVDHYNRAVGSLERNVLPGARKFVELGMRPKKELEQLEPLESLPRSMLEITAENEDVGDDLIDADDDDAAGDAAVLSEKPASG